MKEAYALWLTPEKLQGWAEKFEAPGVFEEIEGALNSFLDLGCKPLLALPESERTNLLRHVLQFIPATFSARLRFNFLVIQALEADLDEIVDFATRSGGLVTDFRSDAAHLIDRRYMDCFEMGTRVYTRAQRMALLQFGKHADAPPVPPEKISAWYQLIHSAACLDLCATSVLLYLEENDLAASPAIPEELCFFVKEFALSYAASVMEILPPRRERSGHVEVEMTPEDRRWDRDFCALNLPDLAKSLWPSG